MPAAVDCAPRTPICSRAPPDPLRPHGRATHAHGVVGERTDPINAKLGERGTSKGGLSGIFCCCIPAFSPPFFIRTKTNKCFFCFVLAVCHSSALEPWTLDVKLEVAPPPPRCRKTAPCPLHTAAQGVIGERSGTNSQLGDRELSYSRTLCGGSI